MKYLFAFFLAFAFTVCAALGHAAEMLNGAGASFPAPVYSAWALEYGKVAGVRVNYQSLGSGGGIKQTTERTIHFGASDKPLSPDELKKYNLLQFPVVIGGVVPVVNIPNAKAGELKLDQDTVCGIFLGNIPG